MERPANVVNVDGVAWEEQKRGTRYEVKRKRLGLAAGGKRLGCSLCEVPPGKRPWPLHYHTANEEAMFVLEGSGTLRLGDAEVPIHAGDYVALPIGNAHAHQVVNTGTKTLRFLGFSTMDEPDISVYPESGKIGVFAGSAPGGDPTARTLYSFLPLKAAVDYWDGEE
jgi:uncharacterized cupin superfamily protein